MSDPNTALVTGASAGIGAVYADRLARRGHDLILVARDETRLNTLAERLRAETGRSAEVLVADLSARPDLIRVEHRLREDPSIAMLVNNAGIALSGPMHGSDVDRLEAMVDLNITAPLRLAHAAVAGFVARGRGTLMTNIGIRVQAVLPGATRTELWGKAGIDIATMPSDRLMDVDEMVDAALIGLDMGEPVTIPSLPEIADWSRFNDARLAMGPNLSLAHAAGRYKGAGGAA
jgi:short-subunit dehydrogenase